MNVQEIRTMVRTQLDLDETDLPDPLLDQFIRDGYDHVINTETRWPFFETLWQLNVSPFDAPRIPPDAAELDSIVGPGGVRMGFVSYRYLEANFNMTAVPTGIPSYWTRIGNQLVLYPTPYTVMTVVAHGHRRASDWVSEGAGSEVDADVRLHLPIVWYCCSVGYAQQEDDVLERTYMARFQDAAQLAHDAVMRPWSGQPRQLSYVHYKPQLPVIGSRSALALLSSDVAVQDTEGILDGGTA